MAQTSSGDEQLVEDVDRSWIHQVEHEETIVPEAVNEEEIEEYTETDGVVDYDDIEENVLLHPNEIGLPSDLRYESKVYYTHNAIPPSEMVGVNLPDLLSRCITFTNGSKMYLCFSKRCRKQLAFEGRLYNIDGFVKPNNWNLWRCVNPSCYGTIRTSPNLFELRVRDRHRNSCRVDDTQIRLRIAVYDLRLMAEYTDLPLESLYHAYFDKVVGEHRDIAHLFPPFDLLRNNLEDHRANLIYRKRFTAEARESDTFALCDDVYGTGSATAKFRRTKLFPPTLCMRCNSVFRSTPEIPAQDQLLDHMYFDHNRKTSVVTRFTFIEPGLFEQWIRELQYHSPYRLKKLCLHDEHMYYLCQNDARHYKSSQNMSNTPDLHCTAFVRVLDWRLVIQGELNEVAVDYCLDHYYHSDGFKDGGSAEKQAESFTPEVFLQNLMERRERTQQIIQDKTLQRIKRRHQQPSISIKPLPKTPKLECAQRDESPQQNGSSLDYGSGEERDHQGNVQWTDSHEGDFAFNRRQHRRRDPYLSQYVTKRENFPNAETYHAVLQFEMTCNMLRDRMQYSRGVNVVNHYLDKLTAILDDVMADPLCAPSRAQNRALLREEQAANDEAVISTEVSERGCDVASPSTASEVTRSSEKLHRSSPNVNADHSESLPLRQKVLLRRGDNGQIVVVRRTILGKVRKIASNPEMISRDNEEIQAPPDTAGKAHPTEEQNPLGQTQDKDGPPIGDVLRDALLLSGGYERPSIPYRMRPCGPRPAAQGRRNPNDLSAQEQAKQFIQKASEPAETKEKVEVSRRTVGRPRKYSSPVHNLSNI
ncbi:hypothetical protein Q1695_010328 [Nippostrongylus brasiliensis]|nr:hypothetical protein Q1695_010328 [Nippostrongylus brasiliensis]